MTRLLDLHRELGIPLNYEPTCGLPLQTEAEESALETIATTDDGTEIRLVVAAAAAWRALETAARHDGIILAPVSGFRSVDRQGEIIRRKQQAGVSLANILRSVAAPGYSEHHTGRALDFVTPGETSLEESFAHTPAFHWLGQHAHRFGFHLSYPRVNPHGIVFEPWHWCWRNA